MFFEHFEAHFNYLVGKLVKTGTHKADFSIS